MKCSEAIKVGQSIIYLKIAVKWLSPEHDKNAKPLHETTKSDAFMNTIFV